MNLTKIDMNIFGSVTNTSNAADDDRLYACANHFGVSRETVNYWINEALTDEEV